MKKILICTADPLYLVHKEDTLLKTLRVGEIQYKIIRIEHQQIIILIKKKYCYDYGLSWV